MILTAPNYCLSRVLIPPWGHSSAHWRRTGFRLHRLQSKMCRRNISGSDPREFTSPSRLLKWGPSPRPSLTTPAAISFRSRKRSSELLVRSRTMKKVHRQAVDGPQKEYFTGGELSGEGRFRNGKRNGQWKLYYRNRKLKAVGKYLDGVLDGHWEWWRENGQPLQAGAFKHGKQVGQWKRYYENGQLWDEGTYDDGKKVGDWVVFDKAGALKQSKVFKAK